MLFILKYYSQTKCSAKPRKLLFKETDVSFTNIYLGLKNTPIKNRGRILIAHPRQST